MSLWPDLWEFKLQGEAKKVDFIIIIYIANKIEKA